MSVNNLLVGGYLGSLFKLSDVHVIDYVIARGLSCRYLTIMARTTRRGPTHPYFRAPTPPAHPRPTPIPFNELCCFAELYTGLTAQALDSESTVILVPKDYNGDDSSD